VDELTFGLEIGADHRSSSRARRDIGSWLTSQGFPDRHIDDCLLVVSELVTNAVVHAGTTARVVVRWDGHRVLVEVFDQSTQLPRVAGEMPRIGGRGLFIVQQLSSDWGVDASTDGKRVWATLDTV
jgi:anti-sigma regulatory factor (Ser/Thr protein kinase)